MPATTPVEAALCRSAPWRFVAARAVLPWALTGVAVEGEALEVGAGSGAMAAALLARRPGLRCGRPTPPPSRSPTGPSTWWSAS